jgi:hypothetical protein
VTDNWTPGSLLGQSFPLENGVRVRLRLARFSDLGAIHALRSRGTGALPGPVPAAAPERLVQFDPRHRYVVCAMALIDSTERLVGIGAIELGPVASEPDVLLVDPDVGEALSELLDRALRSLAAASARARAA